jgi:hypothetical protein
LELATAREGYRGARENGRVKAVLRRHADRDGQRHREWKRDDADHRARHDVGPQMSETVSFGDHATEGEADGNARFGDREAPRCIGAYAGRCTASPLGYGRMKVHDDAPCSEHSASMGRRIPPAYRMGGDVSSVRRLPFCERGLDAIASQSFAQRWNVCASHGA